MSPDSVDKIGLVLDDPFGSLIGESSLVLRTACEEGSCQEVPSMDSLLDYEVVVDVTEWTLPHGLFGDLLGVSPLGGRFVPKFSLEFS